MRTPILLALALSLSAFPAQADIAPEPLLTGGNNVGPRTSNTPVAMVAETVDLWPSRDRNKCVATFVMKNTSSKPVTMEVGFPSLYEVKLEDFALSVAGKPQSTETKKEKWGRQFKTWRCWTMTFPPGKQVLIKVSYWTVPKLGYNKHDLTEAQRKLVGTRESGYVLRTGAGWHGPIGKGTINVHHDSVPRNGLKFRQPKRWTYDKAANRSVFKFVDLEPAPFGSDIHYEFEAMSLQKQVDTLMAEAEAGRLVEPFAQEHLLNLMGQTGAPDERKRQAIKACIAPFAKASKPFEKQNPGGLVVTARWYTKIARHLAAKNQLDDLGRLHPHFQKLMTMPYWKRSREAAGFRAELKKVTTLLASKQQ